MKLPDEFVQHPMRYPSIISLTRCERCNEVESKLREPYSNFCAVYFLWTQEINNMRITVQAKATNFKFCSVFNVPQRGTFFLNVLSGKSL